MSDCGYLSKLGMAACSEQLTAQMCRVVLKENLWVEESDMLRMKIIESNLKYMDI